MNFGEIILFIILVIAAIVPVVLTVWNIRKIRKKKSSFLFEIIAFVIGMISMTFDYVLTEPVNYKEALNSDLGPVFHEAFSRNHLATLIVIWIIGLVSYFILKYYRKGFPPIIEAALLAGVYAGLMISLLAVLQLSASFRTDFATIIIILYMYLFFFNYFLLVVNLLVSIAKNKAAAGKDITYKNAFLQTCSSFLIKGSNRFIGGVILMLPLLAVLILILILFGQEPDSVIKAFTQTSDWLLSTKLSPPPLEGGGHYLCTVSLRGHKSLVKPVRFGIRNGSRIIVNRQLCIANAFEQLIMEKAPVFHKTIRNFYDTYGYPVSKHINRAWAADAVYLLMKPLEWLFLIVLYTFDKTPENRIATQYLPKIK